MTQIFQPFWNSINSVQKALDLTIPAKNIRKMSIIDLNFQIKKLIGLASRLVWNWPYKFTTDTACFLWNLNVQMATVWKGISEDLIRLFESFEKFANTKIDRVLSSKNPIKLHTNYFILWPKNNLCCLCCGNIFMRFFTGHRWVT